MKKIIIIVTTILIAILNVLSIYTVTNAISYWEGYKALNAFQNKNIYQGNDQITDNENKQINGSNENKHKAQKIIKYLDKNFKYSIFWDSSNDSAIKSITIDQKGLELYPIKIVQGRNLNKEDFNKSNVLPVLIGESLLKKYPLNSKFKYFDGSNGKLQQYHVVGILASNSSIPSTYLFQNQFYLNNTIISPLTNYRKKHINLIQLADGVQNLLVFNSNRKEIHKLEELFKLEQLNVKFYSTTSNINAEAVMVKSAVEKLIAFILLLWILSMLLFVKFVKNQKWIKISIFIGIILASLLELIFSFVKSPFSITYIPRISITSIVISILFILIINILLYGFSVNFRKIMKVKKINNKS